MRRVVMFWSMILLVLTLCTACAGIPLPFTDHRLGRGLVESNHDETNSSCTDLETLNVVANALEAQHLAYIRTKDDSHAIKADSLHAALGEKCKSRFERLDIPQIKDELFGDIQTIKDSDKLRELGGLAFEYEDVSTKSGIEISLHMDHETRGPKRRLVAVYRLEDNTVIHYNYSGTNNVDRKSRSWPIREFFGAIVGVGMKAVIP